MSRYTCLTIGLSAALLLGITSPLISAELRTTVGNQTVYRTVSFKEAISQKAPEFWDDGPVWDDACPSCGIAECALDCARPCGFWADLEYLLWWRRGSGAPPLVTTSPDGTLLNDAGVLGLNSTTVLFGGQTVGGGTRPGGRLTVGTWLDCYGCYAVEGRFYALGRQTTQFNVQSFTSPILTRPFTNQDPLVGPLGPTSRVLTFPNIAEEGRVDITGTSEVLGGDILLRRALCSSGCWDVDFLIGYQFARIDEDLVIFDSLVDRNPNNVITDGTRQDIEDRFETRNKYHAGQFGIEATYWGNCWRLELLAKVALGNMNEVARIVGQTTNDVPNDPNSPVVLPGGLLANSGNSGLHEQDEFAAAPEIVATMVYEIHECIDVSLGYSYIYFSKVAQAGEQIEPNLSVPSSFQFNTSSYWLHGLRFGAEWRF